MNKSLTVNLPKLIAACLAVGSVAMIPAAVTAQDSPSISELTVVNLEQTRSSPTGPYGVVVEHDPGLATHTIYRPRELDMDKHPIVVWGEGGCADNGLMFPEFLSEIASYGFVIVADGPPGALGAGAGGPNGPAARGGGAAPVGAPPAAASGRGAGGPPGGDVAGAAAAMAGMVNGADLIAAVDWLESEASDRDSRFYGKIDVSGVAAMGMSCGGLMSYGAAGDRRVSTIGIWNSGLFEGEGNNDIYADIHGSVIIVTGGESDMAYPNGKRDFDGLPESVPVFYAVYPSVGHGGTYNQDNGGPFGEMAVAWLKWQLMDDTSATGRGYFQGDTCGVCKSPDWQVDSRSLH